MVNSVSTSDIEAIISRNELIALLDKKELDPSNLVLISISEPVYENYADEALTSSYYSQFKDALLVKFWDITEDIFPYTIIPNNVAKQIQDFIIKHKDERFLVHCRAGQSRSAAVGKAIECIKHFGIGEEAVYNYSTSFSSEIDSNSRYFPNLTVFNKITKKESL